jgi:hypothetical protein
VPDRLERRGGSARFELGNASSAQTRTDKIDLAQAGLRAQLPKVNAESACDLA